MINIVKAIEVYELYRTDWSDEYDVSKYRVGTYLRRYKAKEEQKRREAEIKNKGWHHISFTIKPKLVKPDQVRGYVEKPSNFKHIEDVEPIKDACGEIRELHSSENLSLAYVNLSGQAKKHKHSKMEEVYFVTKGEGYLTISDEKHKIEQGDTISIPKDAWHFLETEKEETLEVLVVTHPKYTQDDVIEER